MTYPASVEHDDADLVLFSQDWSWGYSDQPPLYNWVASAAFSMFGLGVPALVIVRLAVLLLIPLLLYRIGRMLTGDRGFAVLGAHSVLLVGPLAWNSLTYLTHTLALIATCLWVLLSFLEVVRYGRWRDYLLFGMALGLAGLSKYNAVWFALAVACAGLTLAPARRRLLDPRILVSIAIAGLVVAPHALWLLDHWQTIAAGLQERAVGVGGTTADYPVRLLAGMKQLLVLLLVVAGPPALVVAFCFRGMFRTAPGTAREHNDARRLVGRFLLFGLAVILLQVIILGATRIHERWLMHFAAILPVWLLSQVNSSAVAPGRLRSFALVLVVLGAGYLAARVIQLSSPPGNGYGWHPIKEVEDDLARAIAQEAGESPTIITPQKTTAGNLRLRLPGAAVIYSGYRNFPGPAASGTIVLVWNRADGPLPPWHYFGSHRHFENSEQVHPTRVRTVVVAPGEPGSRPPGVMAFLVLSRIGAAR